MNWGELKTAFGGFIHRGDLSALVSTFKELAESRIYYGSDNNGKIIRPLRLAQMQTTKTTGLPSFPSDFLELVSLSASVNGTVRPLTYKAPDEFAAYERDGTQGYYTIKSGQIVMAGNPTSYSLIYYAKFYPLSADYDTNWLLTNNSSIYLYAMLLEACIYSKDDQGAIKYALLYGGALNGLRMSDSALMGGVLVMPNPS